MEAQDTLSYQGLEARAYQLVGIGAGYASFQGFQPRLLMVFGKYFQPNLRSESFRIFRLQQDLFADRICAQLRCGTFIGLRTYLEQPFALGK